MMANLWRTGRYEGCEEGGNQPHRGVLKVFFRHDKQFDSTKHNKFLHVLLPEPGFDSKYMIFKRLFRPKERPERGLYAAIVAAARHVQFYQKMGVADTIDGRFEMIVLHLFLVLNRLKGEGVEELRQNLTDEFFRDMDGSLRELGVNDVTVGKKVRKLAESYYGRVLAYDKAIGQPEVLEETIIRNIYADGTTADCVKAMCQYILSATKALNKVPLDSIRRSELNFQ